ncbi:PREDICTED: uncharacterized protein LOC108611803 [Drosophila arizonae]|uniref:Uncharacterized protein LOC108611803 n=1 Tax=Drosophila arizonae TaxID=7263 RepID=A0ABM1NYQ6_DROAR|nr:PREDICTED: uncharacterized protein LOC108611803 [Drosophila arizonae]
MRLLDDGSNATMIVSREARKETESTTEEPHKFSLPLPSFKRNYKGNWVYHIWGFTLGSVWQDTRFKIHGAVTLQRILVDSKAVKNYYPLGNLGTACVGRSTIYNFPKVMSYVMPKRRALLQHRPIWTDLRRQLYLQGRSEECHTKEFVNWREFAECQLRRHMRMEYLIPKYPLQQL